MTYILHDQAPNNILESMILMLNNKVTIKTKLMILNYFEAIFE